MPTSYGCYAQAAKDGSRSWDQLELLRERNPDHQGLERMLVDIGAPVRIGSNLGLQTVDVPELGRRRVSVEQIVDAERGSHATRESIMNVEVQLPIALPIDLTERRRGVGAGCRYVREVMHGGGIDAGSRRQRVIPQIAIDEAAAPRAEIVQ